VAGILLLNLGRAEEAVRALQQCVFLEPEEPTYRRWLAVAFEAMNREEEAGASIATRGNWRVSDDPGFGGKHAVLARLQAQISGEITPERAEKILKERAVSSRPARQ